MPEYRDKIMVGMASVPGREHALERAVASIAPQADRVVVALNGHQAVPAFLAGHVNVEAILTGPANGGDAEKFAAVDGWDGVVVTCDDDLLYPAGYVARLLDGLDRHGRGTMVGFHGGTTSGWKDGVHGAATERRIRCLGALTADEPVNVLGTGTLAYDARRVPLWRSVFASPNMADVHLACHAHRMGIPMVALAHDAGWLTDICPAGAPSIYESNRAGDGSVRDTRARRRVELDQVDWQTPPARPRVRVSVATCDRAHLIDGLLDDLEREAAFVDLDVAVYEDPAGADYAAARARVERNGWSWHRFPERLGKQGYWLLVDRQFADARSSDAGWFVFLPDDVRLVRHAVPRALTVWRQLEEPATLTLWRLRDHEDTGSWTGLLPVDRGAAFESFFVDGNFVCGRDTLAFFDFGLAQPRKIRPRRVRRDERLAGMAEDAVTSTSSGVGRSMSLALHRAGRRMYRVASSLAPPLPAEPSVMNPDVTDRRFPGVAL